MSVLGTHHTPKLSFLLVLKQELTLDRTHTRHNVTNTKTVVHIVDPTRSTGRRDSLLKWKENVKRKCGLIFEFWKIRPKGGTVLLWSRHLLLSLFLNGENQVRTKNPNDSSMEKKRSAKTKFLGPGIRLPIRKVLHMR